MKRIIFFVVFINFLYAAENIKKYIKTDNVSIYEKNDAKSKVIAKLPKNTEVSIIKKEKRFVFVEVDKQTKGWVFEFNLTDKKPEEKGKKTIIDTLANDNYASREGTVRANIRGLNEISKEYAKEKKISEKAINAIIKMEQRIISDDELMQFMKEGKLGEFSEGNK